MVLTYINQSNGILARLLSSQRAGQMGDLLTAADYKVRVVRLERAALCFVGRLTRCLEVVNRASNC